MAAIPHPPHTLPLRPLRARPGVRATPGGMRDISGGEGTEDPDTVAPRVLVVDDHPDIRGPMVRLLARHGFDAIAAADAVEMDRLLSDAPFDVILLDVMLPGEDGFSICERLRATDGPPVILLTARGEVRERVHGLELGAEDYVVKPFEPDELIARINNVVRRAAPRPARAQATRWRIGDGTFNPLTQELTREDGRAILLSSGESRLLEAFAQHAQQILDRDRLLMLCERGGADVFDRSIDSHISRLRRKIEETPHRPRLLTTVWGKGYRLTVACERLGPTDQS